VLSANTAAAAAAGQSVVASLASPEWQSAALRSSAVQCWPGSRWQQQQPQLAGSSLCQFAARSYHTRSVSVSMRKMHPSVRSLSASSLYCRTLLPADAHNT